MPLHTAHAVVLATGGYSNVYYLPTNALQSNASAIWRAHRQGALLANPCFTQIHPTYIPSGDPGQSKLTLMSESLRNDGRIWLPATSGDSRAPEQTPEAERDYFLERLYPQGLLVVCPSKGCPGVATALAFAGTAFPLWLPIPPPRLVRQAI